jgi:hypothetical protein
MCIGWLFLNELQKSDAEKYVVSLKFIADGFGEKGFKVTGLRGCRVTGLQGYRVTGLQGYRVLLCSWGWGNDEPCNLQPCNPATLKPLLPLPAF